MTVRRAPYQPDQEISDYTARDLVTSSAITGDFTTDSLKYGFGPTSLSAEDGASHLPKPRKGLLSRKPKLVKVRLECRPGDPTFSEVQHRLAEGGYMMLPHDEIFSESVWVMLVSGDDATGVGYINNIPINPKYELGQLIEWDMGDVSIIEDATPESLAMMGISEDVRDAEDDYDSTYGKEQAKIRRRLKKELMGEATMGTKAGQWSARKSQELKRRYEAACERAGLKPYRGSKTAKQKDLSDWSDQDWRTSSGGKSSVTGEPYFPAKAVQALKERELYAKAKRQKAAATRAGKQRATYSDDIQAVVARYRAEDDNTDDLSSDQLIGRMEEIGQRMDEIVQRHGGSYEKAERDPAYLRLANQHTALARAYARRHGFSAEEPPMDIEEEAQARLEAIRQLQWGLRAIDRMMREGNIEDAIAFTRKTISAMDQEEDADRELGLDPDRFSAEDGSDSGCYDPDHWDCNSCFEICLDCHPEKIGGQDSIGENICTDCVAHQMAGKEPCECGYDSPYVTRRCIECVKCFGCEVQLYESGDYGMVCTDCAQNVYGFNAESEDGEFDPWAYSMVHPHHDPDWLYEHHIVQGLSAQDIAGMLGVPVNTVTRRIHEFGLYDVESRTGRSRSGDRYRTARVNETKELLSRGYSTKEIAEILGVSDYTVRTYRREIRSQFSAEDDPVSRIAAGTNDALADFANAHDTDDGFYFAGGLIGGLAIAVAGNIIANHVQRWIDARRGGSS